jgi:hypothetical protein
MMNVDNSRQGIYIAKQEIETSRRQERQNTLTPTLVIVILVFTTETHMDQHYDFDDARE